MKLVVDHLRGARRGERQVFEDILRIALGRHPGNDVAFDGRRDLDASTRHAEIAKQGDDVGYAIRDLGSSNGLWIDGQEVPLFELRTGEPVEVEFGRGGPLLRLWIGEDQSQEPPPARRPRWWRRFLRW